MISVKNSDQIKLMKEAGRITGEALYLAGEKVRAGMTTKQLDTIIRQHIESRGARPSFLGYGGFPGSACISINNQVIHGIPGSRVIEDGDIVKVDVGAFYKGYHGDSANTFAVGNVSAEAKKLIEVTKQSFWAGIAEAKPGNRVGDIGFAVQSYIESQGFSVVREFVGHGVGRDLHEEPEVPNYGRPGHGARLVPGMTIAIEPMVNQKGYQVEVLGDGWTTVTKDGGLSAHFEHTIAITESGPVILTRP